MSPENPTGLPEDQRYVIGYLGHYKNPMKAMLNTFDEMRSLIELSRVTPPYTKQVIHNGDPCWILTPRGQQAFDDHISKEEVQVRVRIRV